MKGLIIIQYIIDLQPLVQLRDAPLDFHGGRKFLGKKIRPCHEDKKKIAKKNHPVSREIFFLKFSKKKITLAKAKKKNPPPLSDKKIPP